MAMMKLILESVGAQNGDAKNEQLTILGSFSFR
jgi:hypothetical protein